jgi:oxygen-independent coproporphyrinogen-3 oxidase
MGINRLSIGVQSFEESALEYLGRKHSAWQAEQSVLNAFESGFSNLSIDLIYAIPTLTAENWQSMLETISSRQIPHISAYWLTIEDKTPLDLLIRKGSRTGINENLALTHYKILTQVMESNGYEHYEVSNFSLPGACSKHNTAYWQGVPYLGVGPAAHSFNRVSRQWNTSNLDKYIYSVGRGKVESEMESLSPVMRVNEYLMTSLRTMWGCDMEKIEKESGTEILKKILKSAEKYIRQGNMKVENGRLKLTPEGLLFADGIAASLFTV